MTELPGRVTFQKGKPAAPVTFHVFKPAIKKHQGKYSQVITSALDMLETGNPVLVGLRRTFDYRGRSRRSVFWVISIVCFVTGFAAASVGMEISSDTAYVLFGISMLPVCSATVRRMHDCGASSMWLLPFILAWICSRDLIIAYDHDYLDEPRPSGPFGEIAMPFVVLTLFFSIIFFFKWSLYNSQPGANEWGQNPKEDDQPT